MIYFSILQHPKVREENQVPKAGYVKIPWEQNREYSGWKTMQFPPLHF